ncbi:hypothetical protein WH47_01867 [Habropoda laboriosa]|uniref:Uncharacterized protein n=1 Tax=Habropoda laboriosa TaxID=597456 RepID=A0A0L7QTX6_9HYME|nr:hypothetical protein WH47_01867 [Habropoda laboriosa]
MYSASTSPGGGGGQGGGGGGEVTLRLREPEDIPEEVLARLEDTATLSISLQGDAVLRLGAAGTGNGNLELFDSESGPDLTLSPQTFTSTAEAFINDNSDSLGVPGDNDTGYLPEQLCAYSEQKSGRTMRPQSVFTSLPSECLDERRLYSAILVANSKQIAGACEKQWNTEFKYTTSSRTWEKNQATLRAA